MKINYDNLKISSTVSPGRSGYVRCTGPLADVEAWKAGYFRSYHPAGYGTYEVSREPHEDGTVTLTVWRAHSCD